MSNYKTFRPNEDDILSSQSSDEKMDTGSESFKSQDTPNSVLSSDFEEPETNVLRLQNPESNILRLPEIDNDNIRTTVTKLKEESDDSFLTKMSNLAIDCTNNRPKRLGLSPPKFNSTLILTTNHPLMGISSPDYPDLIPKRTKPEDEKDSLSSIEDERPVGFYSPQQNTSKSNLYISENFVTAESLFASIESSNTPDVVTQKGMRKIIPRFTETRKTEPTGPHRVLGRIVDGGDESTILKYVEERERRHICQSTPKCENRLDDPKEELHSGVVEWCDSSSHHRSKSSFELPIEMKSNIAVYNDLDSPDVISSSTQEDKSAYQALLDPYTGSVTLRPRVEKSPNDTRRKIQLPPEDDRSSSDGLSVCSMESEDEPPPPGRQEADIKQHTPSDDEAKRSTHTASECSEPIPEYSAADELRDERSWITVQHADGAAVCDMKVIEPYKRVLSHGGYEPGGGAALIVFSACHLPDSGRADYRYVMDNLFLYVIWTLERLVTDEYVLIYLHGSAEKRRLPTFRWLHECYKLIDRRLRKSLKHLYLVHPTFWLKSFVIVTKPFVSSKFFRKISYVKSLGELMQKVPVEPNAIPELVKMYERTR